MKERCLNPNCRDYNNYGARGISVCDRWINSFENFYADMGPAPSPAHSIDRIDANGNYCPENCRWATKREQDRNKRDTISFTYQGESKKLVEWSELLGIKYTTLKAAFQRGEDMDSYIPRLLEKAKR